MGIRIKNEKEQAIFDSACPGAADNDIVKESCGDCLNGYIPGLQHVQNGICFRCNGRGFLKSFTAQEYREREVRRYRDRLYNEKVKAEKATAAREARQAKMNTWNENNADIVEVLPTLTGSRKEIAEDIFSRGLEPTPKQTELLRSLIEQEVEAANRVVVPVPDGATEIVGEIISWKIVPDNYSGEEIVKIVVKSDEGWRVYGTLPRALGDDVYDKWYDLTIREMGHSIHDFGPDCYLEGIKGTRVHFTATITPSNDDEEFGFYSRPRKVQLVK